MKAYLSGTSKVMRRLLLRSALNLLRICRACLDSMTTMSSAQSMRSALKGVSESAAVPADMTSNPSTRAKTASAVGLRRRFLPQTKRTRRTLLTRKVSRTSHALPVLPCMRAITERPLLAQAAATKADGRLPSQVPLFSVSVFQNNVAFHPQWAIGLYRDVYCIIRHEFFSSFVQHSSAPYLGVCTSKLLHHHFVDVTPAPLFTRLNGAHHRMFHRMEMFCRVLVLRRIAAANVSAHQTLPKMHPRVTGLDAVFAAFRVTGPYIWNGLQVFEVLAFHGPPLSCPFSRIGSPRIRRLL